jgi:hypothetical protein
MNSVYGTLIVKGHFFKTCGFKYLIQLFMDILKSFELPALEACNSTLATEVAQQVINKALAGTGIDYYLATTRRPELNNLSFLAYDSHPSALKSM